MKKYLLILPVFLLCAAILTGCSCQHEWMEATCETAKTCSKCDAVEGEALGHSWQEADCETPKTCSRCAVTEGAPLGHIWEAATCTHPKHCSICAATEGQPLEHTWEGEATLFTAPLCAVCGTEGDPLPGYFARNNLVPNLWPGMAADYITSTYVRPDLDTTGLLMTSELRILESDSAHRAQRGFEWRCVDISILFSDYHSDLYGSNVTYARADYYQDQKLSAAKTQEYFRIAYQGKEYRCRILYENVDFYSTEDGNVFQMTCCVQVPVGYDGVVLAFHPSGTDISDKHLHEVEPENILLLQLK